MRDNSVVSSVAQLYANHHRWLHRRLRHSSDAEETSPEDGTC